MFPCESSFLRACSGSKKVAPAVTSSKKFTGLLGFKDVDLVPINPEESNPPSTGVVLNLLSAHYARTVVTALNPSSG